MQKDQNNNKNNRKIVLSLVVALSVLISFVTGYFFHAIIQSREIRLLSQVISIIKAKGIYLEDDSPDSMADALVEGILASDKYAEYYSKEEMQNVKNEAVGNYQGIGAVLYSNSKRVFKVLGNSPAKKGGIIKGDEILSVTIGEETTVIESSAQFNTIINSLEMGSEISVALLRDSSEKTVELKKQEYKVSYITYVDSENSYYFESEGLEDPVGKAIEGGNLLLDEKTALITLEQFEGDVAKQFKDALDYMRSRGRNKLILDLRDNGGGYMDVLLDIASYLIYNNGHKTTEIAFAQGTDSSTKFMTKENNYRSDILNVVVLANHNTASASECLIGAMICYRDMNFSKDNLLVTYNPSREDYSTYGKGIMQTTYNLFNGGALKLTTGKIYWPDRVTSIHEKGISPNRQANCVTDENVISRAMEILG